MLFRSIIFELKRAIHEKNFKISMLIGGFVVLMDLYTFYMQYKGSEGTILIQAWIGTDFQFAYNSLFYVLLPVIACMSYGGSYYHDMTSGYDKNLLIRSTRKNYILSKGIAVYVSAFLSVVLPLLINLFIAAGLYKNALPERLSFSAAGIIDCNRFPVLFSEKPVLYCLVFILIDGLFAGSLGLFSVAVSRWCRSGFAAIMLPFVIYIITGAIFVNPDGKSMAMMAMLNPVQSYITTYGEMILVYVVLTMACSLVVWLCGRKRDVI